MRSLIISPSCNFYGSEQVLFDYLSNSRDAHLVAIGGKGILFKKLSEQSRHKLITYKPRFTPFFYVKVFLWLLLGKFETIYWNEAAHINYSLILAKLFPGKKFIVHIRIIEDTCIKRWKFKPSKNITFITISQFVKNLFPLNSTIINDPYCFSFKECVIHTTSNYPFKIGVIGRLSKSKGLDYYSRIFDLISNSELKNKVKFIFFGDVSYNEELPIWLNGNTYEFVNLAGFVKEKYKIYNAIDCVMHLSPYEPLGRIFFEAIEFCKPLIGINSGGIGEIGNKLGLVHLLVGLNDDHFSEEIVQRIKLLIQKYDDHKNNLIQIKKYASEEYSIELYVKHIDNYFS